MFISMFKCISNTIAMDSSILCLLYVFNLFTMSFFGINIMFQYYVNLFDIWNKHICLPYPIVFVFFDCIVTYITELTYYWYVT